MYCPNCGKQLADTAKFCTGCGTKIDAPAPSAAPPYPAPPPLQPGAPQPPNESTYPSQYPAPQATAYQPTAPSAPISASATPPAQPWYDNLAVIIISLFCCWPLGLVLLWTSKTLSQKVKIIITVALIVLQVMYAGIMLSVILPNLRRATEMGPAMRGTYREQFRQAMRQRMAQSRKLTPPGAGPAVRPFAAAPPASPTVKITAEALFKETQADPEAAESKYKDKPLEVTGTVASNTRVGGEPHLGLIGKDGADVWAVFSDNDAWVIDRDFTNKSVTVRCVGGDFSKSVIHLKNCHMEP